MAARKLWLASHLHCIGSVVLDEGAIAGISKKGRSLLAVGIVAVEGDFRRGDLVACVNREGKEVARGLVNYSAAESRLIIGQPSTRIAEILGYLDEEELVHRDNMVLS